MLGYLAEAAVSYGCSLQHTQQLQAAAGLTGDAGGTALLWRLVAALNNNKGCSLSFLKGQLPSDITYGQIKVRPGAALMSRLHHIFFLMHMLCCLYCTCFSTQEKGWLGVGGFCGW